MEKVESSDLSPTSGILWKYGSYIEGEISNGEYNYYLWIKRKGKSQGKTLILLIPLLTKEGQLTIENIYSFALPEEVLRKVNNHKNFNSYPTKNHHPPHVDSYSGSNYNPDYNYYNNYNYDYSYYHAKGHRHHFHRHRIYFLYV